MKRLLVAVVGVTLMLSPSAAASGGRPLSSAADQQVTVTVTLAGPGTEGTVVSFPAGITCGTTTDSVCSAQFPDQTTVSLEAQGEGSNPSCSATLPYLCQEVYVPFPTGPPHSDSYTVQLDYNDLGPTAAIQMSFLPTAPPHCIVPRARGRVLATAKARIRQSHCGVGTITHAFSRTVQKGRVVHQFPKQRVRQARGAKVDLVVSKGRR